jgi:hypothetical protein
MQIQSGGMVSLTQFFFFAASFFLCIKICIHLCTVVQTKLFFPIPVSFFSYIPSTVFSRCISSSTSSSLSLNLLSPFLCKIFCFLARFSYFLFLSTCLFLSLENLSFSLLIKSFSDNFLIIIYRVEICYLHHVQIDVSVI